MTDNKDIAVLAKKVYELSVLSVDALEARKWEALLILNAVYSSATPKGIDQANAVVLALAEGRAARTPLTPPPSRFGFDLPPDHPLRARCGRPEPAHGPEIQP